MQQHVLGESVDRQRNLLTDDCARIEMQCRDAAVDRGVVVLNAGRDADEARLEIADELDQIITFDRIAGKLRQRAYESDGER